jgi:amino acid permease
LEAVVAGGDAPSMTWQQLALAVAGVLIGAGLLGLPFALRAGGGALGLAIIIAATVATSYTAKMLIWCFNTLNARACNGGTASGGTIGTYDELAHAVLGPWGCSLVRVLTLCETHGGCLCFTVLHMNSWPSLLGRSPHETLIGELCEIRTLVAMCVAAVAFPTTLVKPHVLSRFSFVGLLATCILSFSPPSSHRCSTRTRRCQMARPVRR